MAEETVVPAFNKGFDWLIVQLQDNAAKERQAEKEKLQAERQSLQEESKKTREAFKEAQQMLMEANKEGDEKFIKEVLWGVYWKVCLVLRTNVWCEYFIE